MVSCLTFVSVDFSSHCEIIFQSDDEAKICTVDVLVVDKLRTSIFNPVGKSEAVVYTVCIYESTLHSDCGNK